MCRATIGRRSSFSALAAVLAVLAISAAAVSSEVVVTVHSQWPADHSYTRALEAAAEVFQERHPDIRIEVLPGQSIDASLVAIAGGAPPDIVWLATEIPAWARRGLLHPLDHYIGQSGVDAAEFFEPAWRRVQWRGRQWGMPHVLDVNFALVWNKTLFLEAGLDPEAGPETIADLDATAQRLTRYRSDGSLAQLGIAPWTVYGDTNTILTWSWAFGGSFFDPGQNRVTAAHDNNVRALEWLRDYYERYAALWSAAVASAVQSGTAFSNGVVAMQLAHSTEVEIIRRAKPDIELGFGFTPYDPEQTLPNPSWLGGYDLAIPAGAPHPDAAWEFIRFITADPEGVTISAGITGAFPGLRTAPVYDDFRRDSQISPYFNILETARHVRPIEAAWDVYNAELGRAVQLVYAGEAQPRVALARVQAIVQAELDRLDSGE